MNGLFPGYDVEAVLAATATYWDTSGPIPVPRPGWLACPVCRHRTVQPRYWRFFRRPHATIPGRCDVSFKCVGCAAVWTHGVALDDDTYIRMTTSRKRPPNGRIGWREARQLLDAERGEDT